MGTEHAEPARLAASLASVQAAAARIKDLVHHTPVLTCSSLDIISGHSLLFKAEIFQKTGAFKYRGACNAVFSLAPEVAQRGVVTHSSGNHAAALALAAKVRGIPAHIVVPRDTPRCKVEAIQGYGGLVTLCEPTIDAREAACAKLQAETGAVFIPPYNHPDVISGQGTLALELLEQVKDLDVLVVPVSGGGMISGCAVAVKEATGGRVRVVAAEPVGRQGNAADVAACKAAGQLVTCTRPDTIADGLQGRLGDLTWPIVRDHVDAVVTVTESEIVAAMKLIYERLKVVVEPSGAVGLAAVLAPAWRAAAQPGGPLEGLAAGGRVGVVLCGGNVDLGARGLWGAWGVPAPQ